MDINEIRRQYEDGTYSNDWNSDQINIIGTLLCELEAVKHLLTVSEEVNAGYEKDCSVGHDKPCPCQRAKGLLADRKENNE